MTNADAGVRVLEREQRPIAVHDVARAIQRDIGKRVPVASLQVALSQDRRFCWAGKGLYGLFRHRLLPGPRSLGGIGKFLLYAHGEPLDAARLAFVMKYLGYRFQNPSLAVALSYEPGVEWIGAYRYRVNASERTARDMDRLVFAPTRSGFEALVDVGRQWCTVGLSEYDRRLES
jgi:hypothetical protein